MSYNSPTFYPPVVLQNAEKSPSKSNNILQFHSQNLVDTLYWSYVTAVLELCNTYPGIFQTWAT